ncbi:hypothetical protein Cri9333_4882 (plasmid) [Crinalium epipsammum PCC 9333]|uniref:Uncharacterized protein n=1 Tax=Crinalium epipsammum PCC 9333 TaxID=1173022 RepID=K9W857_9CYAN|nr:DNA-binding protein [Crinalium epipsammum]AFZ15645.1 hypothetical protein Cri9333_4882 [Crinalium epipsammum PCC 9333]
MSNEVLTTAQAAELLQVSVNCIRQWKSRKAEQLLESIHWITGDNNQTLWTQTGLEALQQIKGVTASVTDDVTTGVTESVTDPLQRYNPLVESVSNAITQGLIGRIDKVVTRNIGIAIAKPMTSTECVTLLTELGLKPCNPELLLSGNQPNLLTESKEN